ncbi:MULTISPECIES: hypothetical protein [unclassified Rhizobium]|uniref:hypothetical protein n=1 Tax=unclassified Rhizobium TaxID=2613769 RepID=UPI001CC80665|nr:MULTISPECIES: hypothetical protein [unclassified Rhizobium]MBZ5762589.1 hypothetical protein [Rhizobium sp. VS19-DR96]MBZ5768587.1 hypothetical protein [Rhizobium sp. VS19-DR129.2]MBZ5776458.1 hypothetical protein [Rhizobium sp. VS19-DRK62.2]MBZ5787314.1 hypothetical protein [Rhizobium sp. VS19-DR121]MBZ5804617.1 hypothetical protein [Rhizobium sp. VS19-DR181]
MDSWPAVIAGGNSGVGFGIAQEFIAQGATAVITWRNQELAARMLTRRSGIITTPFFKELAELLGIN